MALSENHARANKNRKDGVAAENDETIEEALIDLYLSVKIRSNEEVSFVGNALEDLKGNLGAIFLRN